MIITDTPDLLCDLNYTFYQTFSKITQSATDHGMMVQERLTGAPECNLNRGIRALASLESNQSD